jgi:hypothetical protein
LVIAWRTETDAIGGANERRVKCRYPLELNVRYQTVGAIGGLVSGVGQTVNMSSGGMFMTCPGKIPEGTRLKTFVEWPSLLNGTTPLQLIMVGTVVRSTPLGVSIAFESYQFKTMGRTRQSNLAQMPVSLPSAHANPQTALIALMAKSSS